jgi:flagellar biogenesis protein FliO
MAAAYDRAAQRADHKRSEKTAVAAESESSVSSFAAKIVLSLLMVLGAIYGISYLARYWMGGTLAVAPGPLKVLARHTISSKHSIYLVAALDRFLIIGESPQGLSCLSQFENGEANRKLREQWGWDGSHPREANRLYTPATSPFGPSLKAHVEDLEQELARLREAS